MTNDPVHHSPPPPPPGTIDYASAYAPQATRPRTPWRLAWIVGVLLLAGCLIMLMRRGSSRTFTTIPYSESNAKLNPVGSGNAAAADRIEWLRLEGDARYGKFVFPQDIPDKGPVTYFTVTLPRGVGGHYPFFRDLVDRVGLAKFDVEPNNDPLINFLLPLIPWVLIFGFIWLLVRRKATPAPTGTQVVISGPGRWIPDAPAGAAFDAK